MVNPKASFALAKNVPDVARIQQIVFLLHTIPPSFESIFFSIKNIHPITFMNYVIIRHVFAITS